MKFALPISLFTIVVLSGPTFAQCDYGGKNYSVGSTICECPSAKIEHLKSTGEEGKITSRRLACSEDHSWKESNALCLDVSGRAIVSEEYPKYVAMFCPSVNISPAETEKFFEVAPKDVSIKAVEVICRRFGALADACKALIAAIQSANR